MQTSFHMKKPQLTRTRARWINDAFAATERMNLYFAAHPGSPSAVRRPQLTLRGKLWIVLLGPSVEEGIAGIGPTVEAALRAFDGQYLAGLRPPASPKQQLHLSGDAQPRKNQHASARQKLTS